MKRLFLVLVAAVLLGGCSQSVSQEEYDKLLSENAALQSQIEQNESSAYDNLSDKERTVFDALIIGIQDYKNPPTVRIISLGMYDEVFGSIFIKIQAKNPMGGEVINDALLYFADTGIGEVGKLTVSGYSHDFIESDELSVRNLNDALKEYWENLGIE